MALTAKQLKDNKQFCENVAALYGGGLDYQAQRYAMLYNKHTADFGKGGAFFSSPAGSRSSATTPITTTVRCCARRSAWTTSDA